MKHATIIKSLIAAACCLAYTPAFATFTYIVEGGPGGQNSSSYTDASFAGSTGTDTAPGCTATGTRYSGTGTYFGPARYAQATFTPATSGFFQIDLSWPSTAGQTHTAVNLYTGAATGGAADIWGNTGGPQGVLATGTMDMYYRAVSVWNTFTTAQLNSGTAYHVGIYGGYKTPYAGGVTPADASANRVAIGGFRFMAATPTLGAYGGPANGATDIALTGTSLSWAAGNSDSFFDVWFGTSAGSLSEIGTGLSASTLSMSLDSQNLQGGTQYFWRVDAGNVDAPRATGTVFDFTTVMVPEPSTAVLSLLGGLGLAVWNSRRRTA
jgi:hypothetical protein